MGSLPRPHRGVKLYPVPAAFREAGMLIFPSASRIPCKWVEKRFSVAQ